MADMFLDVLICFLMLCLDVHLDVQVGVDLAVLPTSRVHMFGGQHSGTVEIL